MLGVALHCERGGSVSGEGLQVTDRLAALGEQAGAGVTQVVEPDRGKACPLEERLEAPVYDVLSVQRCALARGEDESRVLV